MRLVGLALSLAWAFQVLCCASEISGLWSLKESGGEGAPLAVQLEQDGERLTVLKILPGPRGRLLERREYVLHRDVEIALTREGTEIHFGAGEETWIIRSTGELIVRSRGNQRYVLRPAKESIEHAGVRPD